MICLWPQNTPQFPVSLLHLSQISFSGAFFWGLQTASCRWGADLENRIVSEAIRRAIHVELLAIDLLHYLSRGKSTFFFICGSSFWRFLPSNAPLILYSIRYWWFFLSQGKWWTKYLVHPKIWTPKFCLLMFACLIALDRFYLLLSSQLTADSTLDWSGGSMFYPLSHIYAKTVFIALKQL